ncbi:hypothetical protein ZIOFF_046180 [Zingiber officinale]|uniref:Uncharacterized protein n=1 Tax=Zingiber officinale TaxID=94328 RepID=A0A8J5G838_ZINOF|nr:hypothetical protein ZIOFF_046180 [Zingiber officinale]
MDKQANQKIVNSECSIFQKFASKRDSEHSSVEDLVNGDSLMNPREYVRNHGSLLSLQPWIFRKGSCPKDKEMMKVHGNHYEITGNGMDDFSNNSLIESFPSVNLSFTHDRGQSSLRSRSSHRKSTRPLSSLENCLIPHLYDENFEFEEFAFSSFPSSTLSSTRPLVVTDGNNVISKSSYGPADINLHSGADNTNMKSLFGVSPLPEFRTPKRKSRQTLPHKLDPSNTRRPQRLAHHKVYENILLINKQYLFPDSVDVLHVFSVGVSLGIISTILSNKKEIENLNGMLKTSEDLVHDLQEELEMKDIVTVKELAHEAGGSQKPSIVKDENNHKCLPVEVLRSEIEAELEIELEKLELSINSSSLDGKMSALGELDPDLIADFTDGELKAEKLSGRISEDQAMNASNSDSSSENPTHSANYSVSPQELSLRLHKVIQFRLEERIEQLERTLKQTQKQLQLLESDHHLSQRAFSSSDMGSSSNLDSPTGTAGNIALVQPFCLNLTGEALDAYDEVYEEFVRASNMEENRPMTTYSKDQCEHYLHSSYENLVQEMHEPKSPRRESIGIQKLKNKETFDGDEIDDEYDNDDDEDDEMNTLIKQILEKTRQGSPTAQHVQRMLSSMDDD